eukprot:jgi/Antlo1/2550/425
MSHRKITGMRSLVVSGAESSLLDRRHGRAKGPSKTPKSTYVLFSQSPAFFVWQDICRGRYAWECMCCVASAQETAARNLTRVHSQCASPTSVQSSFWTITENLLRRKDTDSTCVFGGTERHLAGQSRCLEECRAVSMLRR